MIMNENRSPSFQDSKCCLGKGDESLDFGSREIYELNESSRDISEVKGRDELKSDELPLDSSDRAMNSLRKQDQNRLSLHSRDQGNAADSLSLDTYSHDEQQRSREHEHLVSVGEDSRYNGNEARDSSSVCNTSSETETNTMADKNVPDRDAPEFEICYKEIDRHEVKDICIDEGRPEKGRTLLEGSEDDKLDHVFPQLPSKAKEECNSLETAHSDENDDSQANVGAAENAATDSSEKQNSVADSKRPVEEFSKQSEENDKHQLDQIAHVKVLSQNPDVKSADAGAPGEVAQRGSITYNFDAAASNDDDKEQPVNSGDASEHKGPGNVTGKPVVMDEKVLEQRSEHNDPELDSHSAADDQVESPGNTSRSSTEDAETVEPGFPRHEPSISNNNVSAMSRLLHDEGETSFSAASIINYSEPVPFSGSISHRSDASTTSARSFAFPVLQNEWNSSPVRMAKADQRHLRKHKCWRSGLFCCRF